MNWGPMFVPCASETHHHWLPPLLINTTSLRQCASVDCGQCAPLLLTRLGTSPSNTRVTTEKIFHEEHQPSTIAPWRMCNLCQESQDTSQPCQFCSILQTLTSEVWLHCFQRSLSNCTTISQSLINSFKATCVCGIYDLYEKFLPVYLENNV